MFYYYIIINLNFFQNNFGFFKLNFWIYLIFRNSFGIFDWIF